MNKINDILKKYNLVFNQDKKTIGYYQDIIEKEKSNEKTDGNSNGNSNENSNENLNENNKFEFKSILTIILLVLILISIIIVGIVLYNKKGNRKNRANEMDDNYEYTSSINDNKDGKDKILDN
jgi:hypothetical protein